MARKGRNSHLSEYFLKLKGRTKSQHKFSFDTVHTKTKFYPLLKGYIGFCIYKHNRLVLCYSIHTYSDVYEKPAHFALEIMRDDESYQPGLILTLYIRSRESCLSQGEKTLHVSRLFL